MEVPATVPARRPRPRAEASFPVLMKEMRSRMRGNRAPVLLAVSTGLAVLVGLLILSPMAAHPGAGSSVTIEDVTGAGKNLFVSLAILEGVLLTLIVPGLTAGAISSEREKQTLEFLFLTRLSSGEIVLGKYFAALGLVLLLLLCTLPVMAISFLLGGVSPLEVVAVFLELVSHALLLGAIGLYCSVRCARTVMAVVWAYVVCLFASLLYGVFSMIVFLLDHEVFLPFAFWLNILIRFPMIFLLYLLSSSRLRRMARTS